MSATRKDAGGVACHEHGPWRGCGSAAAAAAGDDAERGRLHPHLQGGPGSGRDTFGQNLELYRQLNDGLEVVLTATILGVLGYLAARRRDYPHATGLLGQSQTLLEEVRDGDLTGYDHLQHLLTA